MIMGGISVTQNEGERLGEFGVKDMPKGVGHSERTFRSFSGRETNAVGSSCQQKHIFFDRLA